MSARAGLASTDEAGLPGPKNGPRPVGHQEVERRLLPYPFTRYFTVTSDCDSMDLPSALAVGALIREGCALPIADSFFPEWLYDRALNSEGAPEVGRFLEQNGPWLRAYHQGCFDTVHGWFNRLSVKIADDFTLAGAAAPPLHGRRDGLVQALGQRLAAALGLILERPRKGPRSRHRMSFVTPPGWQQVEPPRYLVFDPRLAAPRATLEIVGWFGARRLFQHRLETLEAQPNEAARRCKLDLWQLVVKDDERLHGLEIEFSLVEDDAALSIERPLLISDLREDIAAQRSFLGRFNLAARSFTSHGIGLVIGPQAMPDPAANDPRWRADDPVNPHYCLDLLRDFGIEFFTSFHNTCALDTRPLETLLTPLALPDGKPIYDFDRYAFVPRQDDGTPDYSGFSIDGERSNHSLADFLGREIGGALRELEEAPGHGGLLYTHLLSTHDLNKRFAAGERPDRSNLPTVNAAGEAAIAELANRYFNLDGSVTPSQRVFVAPTTVLLRMSQVGGEIDRHATYDPALNQIHVERWYDPILQRLVPEPRELRHLPFYVASSASARLLLDGREIEALIRNPADESGRESVSVADVASPRALLGRVFCADGGPDHSCDGLTLEAEVDRAEQTSHCLTLVGHAGRFEVEPAPVDIANFDGLALRFRKSTAGLRFRCDLQLAGGANLACCETGFGAGDGALPIEAWEDESWRVVVLPFHRLLEGLPAAARRPPTGLIERLVFGLEGASGSAFTIGHVYLLRDDERPQRASCLLGGSLAERKDIVEVVLTAGAIRRSARITEGRLYFFEEAVAKGEIVRIEGRTAGGDRIAPSGGPLFEVLSDSCDIDFHRPAS